MFLSFICRPFGATLPTEHQAGVSLRFTPACSLSSLRDFPSPLSPKYHPMPVAMGNAAISCFFLPDTNELKTNLSISNLKNFGPICPISRRRRLSRDNLWLEIIQIKTKLFNFFYLRLNFRELFFYTMN